MALSFAALAANASPMSELDSKLEAELRAIDAAAADKWAQANRARDAADHPLAERLYAEVFAQAPTFLHAERRQCGELVVLKRRDEALKLCRHAVAQEPSSHNLTALAGAIASAESPPNDELSEASALLGRAEELDPSDSHIATTQCQVAVAKEDLVDLRACTTRLQRLAPEETVTAWFSWVLAMSERRFDDADGFVERARKSGAPAEMLSKMSAATADSRPLTDHIMYWGARILGGWAALSALLVLAGMMLSAVTLRTAENWTEESARRGATIRSIYRSVLFVCSALYYLSLPLVLLAVVIMGGGLVYGMLALGWVPIKLALLIVLMVFATGIALVKSVLYRPSDEEPGVKIDLSTEPQLRATLDEVAARIGTRAVDTVYMTPDTNLAVFERKRGERCLVIGAAVLEGMPLSSFKAILAHEYGHFSNRDTAGGGFALSVRRSLLTFIVGLAQSGQATPWNPAWWFASGFYKIFLRVSQGASRLQEILADRRAAEAYGGLAFASGLKHVIACDLRFEDHVNAQIHHALEQKEPLKALWSPLASASTETDALSSALERDPSPYDSHPSPRDRIRWVEHLAGTEARPSEEPHAWGIFERRDHHEREMTLHVYQRLAESGVRPPALPPA